MPLELFFDLVFVLALTQCTTLMSHHTTWGRVGQGILVFGLLWWSWGGYAWLTSMLDPEEGAIRLALFCAMASLLIAAICVPQAFGGLATEFAVTYGGVRLAHIALLLLASRDNPPARRSGLGLGIGTVASVTLLVAGSLLDTPGQVLLWTLALVSDIGIALVFGAKGWRLVPGHFAERHGLIVIIALGESIVAIGVGAGSTLTWGIAAAAVAGIAIAASMWWMYFDAVAVASARRLVSAVEKEERNALARDSYSVMHSVMVGGIILFALGLRKTLGQVDQSLAVAPAFALLGGAALYLLGLVSFRYRLARTINWPRLGLAALLLALIGVAVNAAALVILIVIAVLMWLLVAIGARGHGEDRKLVLHGDSSPATR